MKQYRTFPWSTYSVDASVVLARGRQFELFGARRSVRVRGVVNVPCTNDPPHGADARGIYRNHDQKGARTGHVSHYRPTDAGLLLAELDVARAVKALRTVRVVRQRVDPTLFFFEVFFLVVYLWFIIAQPFNSS